MTALTGEEEPTPASPILETAAPTPPQSGLPALEGSPHLPICVRPWRMGKRLSFPEAVLGSLEGFTFLQPSQGQGSSELLLHIGREQGCFVLGSTGPRQYGHLFSPKGTVWGQGHSMCQSQTDHESSDAKQVILTSAPSLWPCIRVSFNESPNVTWMSTCCGRQTSQRQLCTCGNLVATPVSTQDLRASGLRRPLQSACLLVKPAPWLLGTPHPSWDPSALFSSPCCPYETPR